MRSHYLQGRSLFKPYLEQARSPLTKFNTSAIALPPRAIALTLSFW
ncbi:hypothetical protein [Calothrix sp. NIES-2100]